MFKTSKTIRKREKLLVPRHLIRINKYLKSIKEFTTMLLNICQTALVIFDFHSETPEADTL